MVQKAIREAKQAFSNSLCKASKAANFDTFYLLFQTLRHKEISKKYNLTRSQVSYLYQKYFSKVIEPLLNGESRCKHITKLKYEKLSELSPSAELCRYISKIAKKHNLKVNLHFKRKRGSSSFWLAQRSLIIEGKTCLISESRRLYSGNPTQKRQYSLTQYSQKSLRKFDFLIIRRVIPGLPKTIFILPVPEIIKNYRGKIVSLYIPLSDDIDDPKAKSYHGHYQKIYFWKYSKNWRQFKPYSPPSERENLIKNPDHGRGVFILKFTKKNCHSAVFSGAPSRNRTYNLQLRKLTLYPIELWVLSGQSALPPYQSALSLRRLGTPE